MTRQAKGTRPARQEDNPKARAKRRMQKQVRKLARGHKACRKQKSAGKNPLALANADLANAYGDVSIFTALEVWEGLGELMCNLAAAE